MKKLFFPLALALLLFSQFLLTQEKGMKGLAVKEAKLGKDVQNKKLVDESTKFTVNEKAYLWMRLIGGPADSITVTWKTGDQSYESKLYVGGTPWRTWSFKTLSTFGDWTVTVTDAAGTALKEMSFKVDSVKTP